MSRRPDPAALLGRQKRPPAPLLNVRSTPALLAARQAFDEAAVEALGAAPEGFAAAVRVALLVAAQAPRSAWERAARQAQEERET